MGLKDAVARKAAKWEAEERADNKLEVTKKIAKFLQKMVKFLKKVNKFDLEVALASGMSMKPYFYQLVKKGTMTISVKDSMSKRPAMVRVNTRKYLALDGNGIAKELEGGVNTATLIDDEKLKRKIVRIFAIIKAILKYNDKQITLLSSGNKKDIKKAKSLRKEYEKLNKSVLNLEKEYFKNVAGMMSINETDTADIVRDGKEKSRTIIRNKRTIRPSEFGEVNDNVPGHEIRLRQLKTLRKNVYILTIRNNIARTAILEVKEMEDRFKLLREELDKDFQAINSIMEKRAKKKQESSKDYMQEKVFVGFGEGEKSYNDVISYIKNNLEELKKREDNVVSAEGKLRKLTNRDDAEIFEIDLRKDKNLSEKEKEAKCKERYQEIQRCNDALENCKKEYIEFKARVGELLKNFKNMPSSKEYKTLRGDVGHFSRAKVGIKKSKLEAKAKAKAEAEAKTGTGTGTNNTPPTEPIPAPVPSEEGSAPPAPLELEGDAPNSAVGEKEPPLAPPVEVQN